MFMQVEISCDLLYTCINAGATVRCSTPVIARIITHDQFTDYLSDQPMAKHQIREGIWKKDSEITIVDALVKLANAHDLITHSLALSGVVLGPSQPNTMPMI